MKTRHFFSFLAVSFAMAVNAAPVSPQEALRRLDDGGARQLKSTAEAPVLVSTICDEEGRPAIYHFTYSGSRGFMLLAADNAVAPLLGYSETNDFASGVLPESMQSWLSYYAGQISDARLLGLPEYKELRTRAAEWAAIPPMLTTTWNQTSPYNNSCPTINGRRCVTGCVATAMAQVMNYWKYPLQGKGEMTYSPVGIDENLYMDFSETTFDWENMLDDYRGLSSTASRNAVATLMKACGYSVKMSYGVDSSGAQSGLIPSALKTYFGYDSGCSYRKASDYQMDRDAWDKIVYDDLSGVGPVIYSGQSNSGGHCFVCDGYDGKGYFHINWGWGGLSDGYFLLNELTPGEIGTGGHYGGYNMYQEIAVGIMPPVGRLRMVSTTIDNAASDTGNVTGWGKVYRINDFSNILLTCNFAISGGHVNTPLYVTVYETDPDTKKNGAVVLDTTFDQPLNASDGNVTCTTRLSIPNFNPSMFYTLTIAYELKGKKTVIESIRLAASAGVDDVIGAGGGIELKYQDNALTASCDSEVALSVYSVSGMEVMSVRGENPGLSLSMLSPGVYIARAKSRDGATKILKIRLHN